MVTLGQPIKPEDIPDDVVPGKYKNPPRGFFNRALAAATIFLLVVFVTASQLFAWERVNVLSDRVVQLRQQAEARNTKADCLALYRNDVSTALGQALAANNNLWVSVATRPFAATPEAQAAQAADNAKLGEVLSKANSPLVAAASALSDYDALDPKPDVCPHPNEDTEGAG